MCCVPLTHAYWIKFCFQKLIHSESAIYDVLQDFFYHSKPLVRVAALEVSIRFFFVLALIDVL